MLRVSNLEVSYGDLQVLWGVSLTVSEREIVCLLGPNGAGKSTLVNSVTGLVSATSGSIEFCDERIDGLPTHRIVEMGIAHVLERRRVFPYMTVRENLSLGAYNTRAKQTRKETMEWVFSLFPVLEERETQLAITLSGGEQQMLAIGRGLMSKPKLLMADEPFLGLAPHVVIQISEILKEVNEAGVGVLFIEQNVQQALSVADRGYVLETGRVALEGPAEALMHDERMRTVYLGL